jgi:hypothetical protein
VTTVTGQSPPLRVLVVGLIALVAVLASYVVLTVNGHDTGDLFGALVPLLGVLGLAGHFEARTRQQDRTLGTIQHQTNGALTARIRTESRAAMRDVLREAGYAIPQDAEAAYSQPVPAGDPQS